MAERNHRAAHDASSAESEIREDRDIRPPRNRALATVASRARRYDRQLARKPPREHADKAAHARAEQEGQRGAEPGGQIEGHRDTAFFTLPALRAATLTITLRSRGPS